MQILNDCENSHKSSMTEIHANPQRLWKFPQILNDWILVDINFSIFTKSWSVFFLQACLYKDGYIKSTNSPAHVSLHGAHIWY
jgi:hypothetical protein